MPLQYKKNNLLFLVKIYSKIGYEKSSPSINIEPSINVPNFMSFVLDFCNLRIYILAHQHTEWILFSISVQGNGIICLQYSCILLEVSSKTHMLDIYEIYIQIWGGKVEQSNQNVVSV